MSSMHPSYSAGPYFNYSNPNGAMSMPISRASHGAPPAAMADGSFARTREEQFSRFFGAPKRPVDFPAKGYNVGHYQLPEAYKGDSVYLSEIMIRKITTEERVGTRILAPLVRHEGGMTISWDRWEFNNHLPTRVPEEGVSRMVSMHKEAEQDSMVRYGMALELEHGFMKTSQGQQNFRLNLQQITNAVVEGTEMGAFVKLLNASNTFDNFYERTGVGLGSYALEDILREETALYCAPQKRRDGMIAIHKHIKETLQERGQGNNFVMVVPQGLREQIDSNEVEAISVYNKSANGPRNPTFGKLGLGQVYESRGFYISSARPTVDICYAPSYKGEFNFVTCKHLMDIDPTEYRTSMASIQVYDENRDNFVKIDMRTCLRGCGLFNMPRGGRDDAHDGYALSRFGNAWFGGNQTWGDFFNRHARGYRASLAPFLHAKRDAFRAFVSKHYPAIAGTAQGRSIGADASAAAPGALGNVPVVASRGSLREDPFTGERDLFAKLSTAAATGDDGGVAAGGVRDLLVPANHGQMGALYAAALGSLVFQTDEAAPLAAYILRSALSIATKKNPSTSVQDLESGDVAREAASVSLDMDPAREQWQEMISGNRVDPRRVQDPLLALMLMGGNVSARSLSSTSTIGEAVRGIYDSLQHESNPVSQSIRRVIEAYGAGNVADQLAYLRNGGDHSSRRRELVIEVGKALQRGPQNVGGCLCNTGARLSLAERWGARMQDPKMLAFNVLKILDPKSVEVSTSDRDRFIKWFSENMELYTNWPGYYAANHIPVSVATLRYLILKIGSRPEISNLRAFVSWVALTGTMYATAMRAPTDASRNVLVEKVQAAIVLAAYSTTVYNSLLGASGVVDALARGGADFNLDVVMPTIETAAGAPAQLTDLLRVVFDGASAAEMHNLGVAVARSFTTQRNDGIPDRVYTTAGFTPPERTNVVDMDAPDSVLDMLPIDGRFPIWCIDNNVPCPIGALLLRPHIGHETGVTMGVVPGGRTAYTFYGHPNFEVGDNPVRKVYFGHFTWYSTTVVWNPKGIVRVWDTRSRRYLGGGGTRMYPWTRSGTGAYRTMTARAPPKYDMICTPVPPCWQPKHWYLDITGVIEPDVTSTAYAISEFHYPQSELVASVFGFVHGRRPKSYQDMVLRRPSSNTVCLQGHQVMHGGLTILSQGHWGPDVYPGCGRVRSGYYSMLRPAGHDGTKIFSLVAA